MIQSFVFNDGRPVASNLDSDALRLTRTHIIGNAGLVLWLRRKHWF